MAKLTGPLRDKLEEALAASSKAMLDVCDAIYEDGFAAGAASGAPTQSEFNKQHANWVPYGEDGDMYRLAGSYTRMGAYRKLRAAAREWGIEQELLDIVGEDGAESEYLTKAPVAWLIDPEAESGYGFVTGPNVAPMYDAWAFSFDN